MWPVDLDCVNFRPKFIFDEPREKEPFYQPGGWECLLLSECVHMMYTVHVYTVHVYTVHVYSVHTYVMIYVYSCACV